MNADSDGASWERNIQSISDWLVTGALESADLSDILDGLCDRLKAIGIPLKRVHVAMETLHPTIQAEAFRWISGSKREHEDFPHYDVKPEPWSRSPVKAMIDRGEVEVRYRLTGDGSWRDFPLLLELHDEGIVDYFALITVFRPVEETLGDVDGMFMSWSSDHPDGFSEAHLSVLRRLQPRMGLAAKITKREKMATNILAAYLGGDAAERVLDGQIRLGAGDVIPCVMLYSDLRGSTTLADTLPGEEFLSLLNAYFECTAGVVLEHGGDVLRFIGDAVLAIFPINDSRFTEIQACRAAYDAALAAEVRITHLNAERLELGEPEIGFGLALHLGEVLFGNIGIPQRVEFSVIGPAANEVCRLEGLTKDMDVSIVASFEFSQALDVDWRDLGHHTLRGVDVPRQVFAPPKIH